jgi:hypothetical protein
LFSLSLIGTAFAWFSSLAPNSIDSWDQLEQKFHDHFFSGSYQIKLTDLTSVRQNKEESVSDYLKRFKEVKNRCFNLSLTDSNLADLAARGLRLAIRDRLEGVEFHTLANVLVRGMAQLLKLNKEKEHFKPHRSNVHVVEYDSDSSNNENEVYVAEFVWPSKSKASSCASLKPATKGRQEELKFTFDVSNVVVSLMNCLNLETLKFLILCLHLMKLNNVHIVSFIILILMLLTIAMCFVVRFNRPLMKVIRCFMRCKWISNLFPSTLWSCSSPRSWFSHIKPKLLRERM